MAGITLNAFCCLLLLAETTASTIKDTITLTASGQKGVITTPNYPGNYGGSYKYEWNIFADSSISNAAVHLLVLDSNMSNIFNCYEDIAEVYDGPSTMYSLIRDWCGDSYPTGDIVTSGDSATITFATNSKDNEYRGFKIEYWAESSVKYYLPMEWTVLNWLLLVISACIYASFVAGFVFLYVVEKDRRKEKEKEKDSYVNIDEEPEDFLENMDEEERRMRVRRRKEKEKEEAEHADRIRARRRKEKEKEEAEHADTIRLEMEGEQYKEVLQSPFKRLEKLPNIENYVPRVASIKDWKSFLTEDIL